LTIPNRITNLSVNSDFKFCREVRNGKSGINTSRAIEKRRKRYPNGGIGGVNTDKPIFDIEYVVPQRIVATIKAKKAVDDRGILKIIPSHIYVILVLGTHNTFYIIADKHHCVS